MGVAAGSAPPNCFPDRRPSGLCEWRVPTDCESFPLQTHSEGHFSQAHVVQGRPTSHFYIRSEIYSIQFPQNETKVSRLPSFSLWGGVTPRGDTLSAYHSQDFHDQDVF